MSWEILIGLISILISIFGYWLWQKSEWKKARIDFEDLRDEGNRWWKKFVMDEKLEYAEEAENIYRKALR